MQPENTPPPTPAPQEAIPVQPVPTPQPVPPTPTPRKPRVGIFIGVFLIILLSLAGGILVLSKSNQEAPPQSTPAPSPSPEAILDEMSDFTGGIPINEDTVSVTRVDGKYCLRYKDKIYLPQEAESYEPKLAEPPENPGEYKWYGLVDTKNAEVFSFKTYNDNTGFVFITRVLGNNETYQVFGFHQNQLLTVASFSPTTAELAYRVPKIYQLSPVGYLVALHMFDCWECEREYPQTQLLNIISKQTKVIGQTSYFNWKNDGEYEYKDYIKDRPPSEIPVKVSKFSF